MLLALVVIAACWCCCCALFDRVGRCTLLLLLLSAVAVDVVVCCRLVVAAVCWHLRFALFVVGGKRCVLYGDVAVWGLVLLLFADAARCHRLLLLCGVDGVRL